MISTEEISLGIKNTPRTGPAFTASKDVNNLRVHVVDLVIYCVNFYVLNLHKRELNVNLYIYGPRNCVGNNFT